MALLVAVSTGSRVAQLGVILAIGIMLSAAKVDSIKHILVGVMLFELPIQLDVYIGYEDAVAANNTTSGFNLSLTTACLMALYFLWAAEVLARRRSSEGTARLREALPSLVYFGAILVSTLGALNKLYAFYEIVLVAQALLVFFYLLHWITSRERLLFTVEVLMAGIVFQSLIVIWLNVGGSAGLFKSLLRGNAFEGRVAGTLGHPNSLGSYLTYLLPSCLGVLAMTTSRQRQVLAGTALVFGMAALVMTGSRGAWVGSALAFGLLVLVGVRQRWLSRNLMWVIVGGVLLIAAVAGGRIISRVDGFSDSTALARLPLNQLALEVISDQPLFGVGANNFAESMQSYLTVDYSRAWIATVHNKYLLVMAETGGVGLLTFLWFLAATLRAGWLSPPRGDSDLRPLMLSLAAGVSGAMVHMMVAIYHARIHIHLLWIVAALILAARRIPQRTEPDRQTISTRTT